MYLYGEVKQHKYVILTATTGVKTMPALPNEVQDRILDFLHDDKLALKACALVCRTWVPTSRFHLFRQIQLYLRTADTAMAIFTNPHCTIRSCFHMGVWADFNSSTEITAVLQYLSTRLSPSSLCLGRWSVVDQQTMAIFTQFPSIEYLELYCVHLKHPHSLDDVLVNFQNVRELHMRRCSRPVDAPCTANYPPLTPRLRSLKFSRCKINLDYFMRRRIVPTNLFLEDLERSDISIVGEYFSMFGDRLQQIVFGFGYPDTLGRDNHTLCSGILTKFGSL